MQSPVNLWEQELISLHTRLVPCFTIPVHSNATSPICEDYSVTLNVKMAGNWPNG